MSSLFVSDAHIEDMNNISARFMNLFLEKIAFNVDRLFILGDLFDFWIGYRGVVYSRYIQLLERLRRLAENGVKIVYVEGNHDFNMGHFFTDYLHADVYEDSHLVEIYGKKLFISHGDKVFKKDIKYKIFRSLVRSKIFHTLEYFVPPADLERLGLYLSKRSRLHVTFDGEQLNQKFIRYAMKKIRKGCDGVIFGHSHTPYLKFFTPEDIGADHGGFYANTGDFLSHFTYIQIDDDGNVSLKRLQEGIPPEYLRQALE